MNPAASARMGADLQDLEAAWSAARALLLRNDTDQQSDDASLMPASGSAATKPGSLPPLEIKGPGLFAVSEGNAQLFTRSIHPRFAPDGTLVDAAGRKLLGFYEHEADEPRAATVQPHELRLPADGALSSAARRFQIEDDGSIRMLAQVADRTGTIKKRSTSLGRLCVAIFPAPQKLTSSASGVMRATAAAGVASYFGAGSPNVGIVQQQPRSVPIADLSEQLARIWSLSGRAEIDVAMATASDDLSRTALNLVK